MDVTIFQSLGKEIEGAIKTYVDPGAASLISALRITAVSGIGLYFTCMGYMIMTGAVQESFYEFLKQCTKVIIIAAFALNADIYANWVVEAFRGLESGLSAAMSTTGSQDDTTYKLLDDSLKRCFELAGTLMEKAGASGWSVGKALGLVIAAIIVACCSIIITVLGGATIIAAKFSLAVMFAIGPLFIMCLMWPVTAKFFDSWFSQVVNYIITIVIMIIVMAFAIGVFEKFAVIKDVNVANPLLISFKILAVTLILMFIIRQVAGMAVGLASGFSMATLTMTSLATGAVSPAMRVAEGYSAAKKGYGMAKQGYGVAKNLVKGAAEVAGSAGSTTPIYQRRLMENLQNGFSKK